MHHFKRLAWRLLAGIGVLWGAATLTFAAINLTGGDTALAILGGPEAMPTPEVMEQVRKEYGLDDPLIVRYGDYLGKLAIGDLGESYRLRIPVLDAITQQLGSTIELALVAGVVSVVLSVLLAILTAGRAPWIRSLTSGLELTITSAPSFVVGILLLLVFSFYFHWFPAAGADGWKALVLPTFSLALPLIGVLTQVLRQELEDILEQPFIVMARARGMSEAGVRLHHALKHVMVPLTTLSGFIFASLLGGAVVVEMLFARQGVGRLMLDAANTKDIPIVLGITLLAALIYVVVNLLVDIANALIDPRRQAW